MDRNKTINQRVADFRALIARHRIKLIDVTREAGLDYRSVRANMHTYNLSDERMAILEDAALRLRDRKKKVTPELA